MRKKIKPVIIAVSIVGLLFWSQCPQFLYYQYKINTCQDKNVVIVYDDFKLPLPISNNKMNHGDVMIDILNQIIDGKTCEPIKIDHYYLRTKKLKSLIKSIDNNKTIFMNVSYHPTDDVEYKDFGMTLLSLANDKNITIAFATGNTYKISNNILKNNEINLTKFDENIWKILSLKSKEIKKLAISVLDYNNTNVFQQYLYPYTQSTALKDIVEKSIKSILAENNISSKDEVTNFYIKVLQTYMITALLQAKSKKNIILVSAHTPFSHNKVNKYGYYCSYEKYNNIKNNIPKKEVRNHDNNYSLDCRIEGLVDYTKTERSFGQYPHTPNGTSQAAPAVLAEKILESINKEKEN